MVVGKATYEDLVSQSKTTNGVGSAYGDGSYITMSPYQSPVNDPDLIEANYTVPPKEQPVVPYNYPYSVNPYTCCCAGYLFNHQPYNRLY